MFYAKSQSNPLILISRCNSEPTKYFYKHATCLKFVYIKIYINEMLKVTNSKSSKSP